MESDQWSAKDFAEKDTTLLERILECSTRDAAAWSEGSKIWEPYPDEEENAASGRPRAESNGATKEKTRSAVIDGESFILPNSAILCLEGMSHFLHLITSIPSMASDISTSLIAYLQLFNSRCTQLILGAGATRSAGLKNITTRHLALAAQALSFIATLIPHVREFVRRHAATGPNVHNAAVANLMGEFDKVRRLFQEHQNNIYDKFVEIMTGRAVAHVKTMKALDWDTPTEAAVNLYMEALVKETVTLHRVLSKHLPDGAVQMIMVQVFEGFKSQLGQALDGLQPEGKVGIQRMEQDINFLISRLNKIEGFGDTGEKLLAIVKTKKVEDPPPDQVEAEDEKNGDASGDVTKADETKSSNEEPKEVVAESK
ncbi:putative garp complex component protein [Eutypa lata UCREL1]|uniref:Putative garp complex component protein n=1 Tax=Eutypa lata (strain UCR-EL1) TaxID=1287681 RepID=M7SJ96_EUTLA|nr:putative garp complex component protein [Eutypa lata UCREL1]